jgi:uncharacterized protein YpmB
MTYSIIGIIIVASYFFGSYMAARELERLEKDLLEANKIARKELELELAADTEVFKYKKLGYALACVFSWAAYVAILRLRYNVSGFWASKK